MAANQFYADTKRDVQRTPNLFSAFAETYVGTRTPIVMMATQARIRALLSSGDDLAKVDEVIGNLEKERTARLKAAADLQASMESAGAEKSTALSTMFRAGADIAIANKNAEVDVQVAGIQGNAQIGSARVAGEYGLARAEEETARELAKGRNVSSAEGVKMQQLGVDAIRAAVDTINSSNNDPTTVEREIAGMNQKLQALTRDADNIDPGELAGVRNYLNQFAATAIPTTINDPDVAGRLLGTAQRVLPLTSLPERERNIAAGGVGGRVGPPIDADNVFSSVVRSFEPVKEGRLEVIEGVPGTGGSSRSATSTETASPSDSAGVGGPGLRSQDIVNKLLSEADAIDKKILDAQAQRQAMQAQDPFRGLGGFYEPLGGRRPARPRGESRGGGAPAEPKEAKPPKEPKPPKPEGERKGPFDLAARAAGTFLGAAAGAAFKKQSARELAEELVPLDGTKKTKKKITTTEVTP